MKLLKKNDYNEYRYYAVNEKVSSYYPIDQNQKEKLLGNLARAKREMKDILQHNLTPDACFITLTYHSNNNDYEQCRLDFQHFIQSLKRYTNTKPIYMGTKELQERGAIHYHVIFFNEEIKNIKNDILFNTYITDKNGKYIKSKNGTYKRKKIGLWPHGYGYKLHVKNYHTTSIQSINNYFAKYISNHLKGQLIDKHKKMYFTSRGIKRTPVKWIAEQFHKEIIENSNIIVSDNNITKIITDKTKKYNLL